MLATPARPEAYSVGRPSACSAAFGRLVVEVGRDVEQQVMAVLDDLGDPRVRAVGLVDHEDHGQVRGQRLAQHEPGLRQRPLRRVDEQQHPVDHGQAALDLAAEVGVARACR